MKCVRCKREMDDQQASMIAPDSEGIFICGECAKVLEAQWIEAMKKPDSPQGYSIYATS